MQLIYQTIAYRRALPSTRCKRSVNVISAEERSEEAHIYICIFFHSALADTVIYIYHEWATTIGELKIFSCPESCVWNHRINVYVYMYVKNKNKKIKNKKFKKIKKRQ